jgi:hypothetical protein
MFLLGLLAIIQITFIPGGIALKLFKIRTSGKIMFFLYSAGLSFYINYLTVCLLTWMRIYTIQVILPIICIEICLYIFLYRKSDFKPFLNSSPAKTFAKLRIFFTSLSPVNKTLFAASIITIIYFLTLIPFSAGTSYYFTDAFVQYTRWPKNWAANQFPVRPSHYPQLFSANLSIINIITGEGGLRFFTKLYMPVFFISIILMFFDLALSRKSFVYLAALLIYSLILIIMYGLLYILDVNADIPVSFFGFLTFYAFLKMEEEKFNKQSILLISLFAVSCANTKLAGFYILFAASFWILYKFYSARKELPRNELFKTGLYILIIIAAGNFWYFIQPKEMAGGLDQSTWLQPTYYLRIINAFYILAYSAGLPFFLFLVITSAASLMVRAARPVIYFIILPASAVWMLFFSNDLRNYSFVIPYIAFISSLGLKYIYSKLPIKEEYPVRHKTREGKKYLPLLCIIILPAIGILAGTYSFFNFLIKLSYTLNIYIFNHFRLVNTIEIGYYKYVEYFTDGIRLLCFTPALAYIFAKIKIRNIYVLGALVFCIAATGLTVLDSRAIWDKQVRDIEMVNARNLQALIYPTLTSVKKDNYIYTNSPLYMQLVPNSNTTNYFIKYIHLSINQINYDKQKNNYILLQRDKIGLSDIDTLLHTPDIQVSLDGVDFLLLKVK